MAWRSTSSSSSSSVVRMVYGTKSFFLITILAFFVGQLIGANAEGGITKAQQKAFDNLVKAVKRNGGYVHPSIGLVSPAPTSGAPRGIAIVKKIKKPSVPPQNDVLIKVPISYQMTRQTALQTLSEIIPTKVLFDLPIEEFDDAALLVLLLVHEYGLGKKSKFYDYLQTLEIENPGCGWGNVEDFRNIPSGVEIDDLEAAINYAHRVSNGMNKDYGAYLAKSGWPKEWKGDPASALRWGLCVVSSRATAATAAPLATTTTTTSSSSSSAGGTGTGGGGSGVRLVPLADFANHQVVSGGFIELTGKERLANGDFMDAAASNKDAGAFVVRSIWKCGTSKELLKGDEITVNYNLPNYSAADWFLSLGFVPKELSSSPTTTTKQQQGGQGMHGEL